MQRIRRIRLALTLRAALVFQAGMLYYVFMQPSKKNVVRKRPGRPATGQDPVTAIRLSKEMRAAVGAWAETHDLGRSEAIRRLVELGLKSKAK